MVLVEIQVPVDAQLVLDGRVLLSVVFINECWLLLLVGNDIFRSIQCLCSVLAWIGGWTALVLS